MADTTRRAFLSTAAAVPVAVVPAMSMADAADDPSLAAYARFRPLWDAMNLTDDPDDSDEALDRLIDAERAWHQTPATTAAGLALKVVFIMGFNDGALNPAATELLTLGDYVDNVAALSVVQDAMRLAGMPPARVVRLNSLGGFCVSQAEVAHG